LLTCYSPVRRSSTPKGLSARLACVKHAASVRPEPGSNSPLMSINNRSLSRSGLLTHERASVTAVRPTRKRSWPPLVRSARTGSPTDGVCASSALAFSTLLSSQGADAHLRRTLIRLQGNLLNLPGKVPFVNSVRQNFANSWTCLASRVASAGDLHAQRARGP
jgi:hypothetical protein